MIKLNIKKLFVEGISGFIGWTILLTPYMILITKLNFEQYLSWILMEIILVPPCSILIIRFTNYMKKRFLKYDENIGNGE